MGTQPEAVNPGYPLPGFPQFDGVNDPWGNGICPQCGNKYFWISTPAFNVDAYPNGPYRNDLVGGTVTWLGADDDGTAKSQAYCTNCRTRYEAEIRTYGTFKTPVIDNQGTFNDQTYTRTTSLLGEAVRYNNSGTWVPAIITMTPESWVSGTPAKPADQLVHLTYYVPGGYSADVKNDLNVVIGHVTMYWKEQLSVARGTATGQWWYIGLSD